MLLAFVHDCRGFFLCCENLHLCSTLLHNLIKKNVAKVSTYSFVLDCILKFGLRNNKETSKIHVTMTTDHMVVYYIHVNPFPLQVPLLLQWKDVLKLIIQAIPWSNITQDSSLFQWLCIQVFREPPSGHLLHLHMLMSAPAGLIGEVKWEKNAKKTNRVLLLKCTQQAWSHKILSLAAFFSLLESKECWEELDSFAAGMRRHTFWFVRLHSEYSWQW